MYLQIIFTNNAATQYKYRAKTSPTRMHSSRMRTARFGGHHDVSTGEGVSAHSLPGPMSGVGGGSTHHQKGSCTRDIHLLGDRMADRHLWKRYLPPTLLAGSKKSWLFTFSFLTEILLPHKTSCILLRYLDLINWLCVSDQCYRIFEHSVFPDFRTLYTVILVTG